MGVLDTTLPRKSAIKSLAAASFSTLIVESLDARLSATEKAIDDKLKGYHTGGVPGRNEIDETPELNYPAIIKAILDTEYKAYIGQEFISKRPDKIKSLEQGVTICNV